MWETTWQTEGASGWEWKALIEQRRFRGGISTLKIAGSLALGSFVGWLHRSSTLKVVSSQIPAKLRASQTLKTTGSLVMDVLAPQSEFRWLVGVS